MTRRFFTRPRTFGLFQLRRRHDHWFTRHALSALGLPGCDGSPSNKVVDPFHSEGPGDASFEHQSSS
eukprot:1306234-Alexandrium_andersonii.AAC.1